MLADAIEKMNIMTVGHCTHDRFIHQCTIGGSAFFGAKVAQKLGATVSMCSAVGQDFQFTQALDGIDTQLIITPTTTTFYNYYPEDRARIQFVAAQASALMPQQFTSQHSHLSTPSSHSTHYDVHTPYDLLFLAPVIAEIKPQDPWRQYFKPRLSVLSLQGLIRQTQTIQDEMLTFIQQSNHDLYTSLHQHDPFPQQVVPISHPLSIHDFSMIDVLFLSDEDLIGISSSIVDFEQLRQKIPLIYLTHGDRGCSLYHKQHHPIHIDIYPTQVLDPTGAGDTFAMATSLALLAGLAPQEAGSFGAAAASIIIEQQGSAAIKYMQTSYQRFASIKP